jgi:hypothetical protein
MRTKNLPVPEGPVAPLNARYFWYIAPPAMLTLAYRAIPPDVRRRLWNRHGGATSHLAVRAIMAGGGWAAFLTHALPVQFLGIEGAGPNWWTGVAISDNWNNTASQMVTWHDPLVPGPK